MDHVAPRNTAAHIPIRETAASRQGVHDVAANGSKISNMGAKRIRGFTKERTPLDMTWQIAEVKRPLASIGRICDAGNTAIFTDKGGFIVPSENLKGLIGRLEATDQPVLRMNREQGVYSFDMWVHRAEGPVATISTHNRYDALGVVQDGKQNPEMDFARLGTDLF